MPFRILKLKIEEREGRGDRLANEANQWYSFGGSESTHAWGNPYIDHCPGRPLQ